MYQVALKTLAAARNLVIKVVTPRLQDGSLNLTTWADLVGRHGFEDETITTMRSVAIASSAALDKGKKVVPTDTSLRLKRQFDTNDSPDMDLGVRASEKEERERVRDQGDVVMRDGSDLKELCNLFTASNPFSFIVPQSLMIYASSILCVRSKKEGEQKAAQELARLKTRKQCRRCGELVTIAELEVGSMTCLQIEPIQPSSTPSATLSYSSSELNT
ncbi:hypothetical protein BC829DRAFT_258068 [Chytridium lagenaria]|nr:hypothetical protein BC829DRAFT_258068 [Chytridium lagenaria]